jgi:hypothetical protein
MGEAELMGEALIFQSRLRVAAAVLYPTSLCIVQDDQQRYNQGRLAASRFPMPRMSRGGRA